MKKRSTLIIIIVLCLLLLAGGIYALRKPKPNTTSGAQTTSTNSTAQNDYTGGDNRAGTSNPQNNSGSATDTFGTSSTTTSQAIKSASGNLSLVEPLNGALIVSGFTLSGVANSGIDTVQFRVVDDQTGVVSQGQLSVNSGKFSGTVQFKPTATTGKLDVFSIDPSSGAEINNIKISVRFK